MLRLLFNLAPENSEDPVPDSLSPRPQLISLHLAPRHLRVCLVSVVLFDLLLSQTETSPDEFQLLQWCVIATLELQVATLELPPSVVRGHPFTDFPQQEGHCVPSWHQRGPVEQLNFQVAPETTLAMTLPLC